MAETNTPSRINGIASKIILRKMVLILKNELGILLNKEMFFNTSAKRKRKINKQNNRNTVVSFNSLFIKVTTKTPSLNLSFQFY